MARASARWSTSDVTETEMADESLLAQRGERLEAVGERLAGGGVIVPMRK